MSESTTDKTSISEEIARRKGRLNKLFISSPETEMALQQMHELRTMGHRGLEATAYCMLVIGPTNAGKSRLCKKYRDRADAQPYGECNPVVQIKVPTPFQDKEFLGNILLELGAAGFTTSNDVTTMKRRVVHNLIERKWSY